MVTSGPLVVVASSLSGHRPDYVRHIALASRRYPHVVVACADTVAEAYVDRIRAGERVSTVTPIPDLAPDTLVALARETRARAMVVIDGDQTTLELGKRPAWPGPPMSLLVMRAEANGRTRIASMLKTRLRQALFRRAQRIPGVRVSLLNAPYSETFEEFCVAPDPVELAIETRDRQRWRMRFELADDVRWVALVGAITARKQPHALLDAVRQGHGTLGLLVVGSVDAEFLPELTKAGANLPIRVVNGYVSQEELDGAVLAADAVACIHQNRGPSGVIAKSLALGTPIVATPDAVPRPRGEVVSRLVIPTDAGRDALKEALWRATTSIERKGLDFRAAPSDFAGALLPECL